MCLVVEWPAREAAVLMLAPFAMIFVINEWRAQWKVICFRILTRVRDKDCVKNRVKRAKIVRFTLC